MKRWVFHGLSLLVGGYFAWAGVLKMADKDAFFESILNYHLVGENIAWLVTLYLPWLEFVAGIALFRPLSRNAASCWIAAMLVVFIGILASAAMRGLDIDCGCVGTSGSSVTFALVRNVFLLAAIAVIFFTSHSTKVPE